MKRDNKGFTLIEIMLVVLIIGIIGAIIFPRLTGKAKQARINATKSQIKSIEAALQNYEMDNDRFPTTEQGLAALVEKPTIDPPPNWNGPYLPELPTDAWGNEFKYRCPGENGRDYDIISLGPDGVEGTEDDIKSWELNKRNK